jgi:ABC-type branched-subunit amino acid transport system substrate-binding protein
MAAATVLTAAACGSSSSSSTATAGQSPAGAGNGSSSASGSPLTILFVGDFSGPTKLTAGQEYGGLQSAVYYWNHHGGFDGHQVKVATVDSGGNASQAVSGALKYLSTNPKPAMVWAGAEGSEIAGLIPIMAQQGLFSMSVTDNGACATKGQSTCSNFFSLGGSNLPFEQAQANYFKKLGVTKVGILEENIAFTQGETPLLEQALKNDGISYTKVSYSSTAVNLTSAMSQAKSAGVNGIAAEAYGPAAGYLINARSSLGMSAPMIMDAAGSTQNLPTLVTNQAELKGVYVDIAPPSNGCSKLPGLSLMLANVKPAGSSIGAIPLYVASFGWDGALLFKDLLAADGGNASPSKLISTMNNLPSSAQTSPLYLLAKHYTFSSSDHENTAVTAGDWDVIAAGAVTNGQLHPTCGS